MKLLFITNKKLAAILLLCSIVIILVVYFYLRKEETLLVSAKRVFNAIENGDASILISYMRDEEKKILNLNKKIYLSYFLFLMNVWVALRNPEIWY